MDNYYNMFIKQPYCCFSNEDDTYLPAFGGTLMEVVVRNGCQLCRSFLNAGEVPSIITISGFPRHFTSVQN